MDRRKLLAIFLLAGMVVGTILCRPGNETHPTKPLESSSDVVASDWTTTTEVPSGTWLELPKQSVMNKAADYVDLNKNQIQLINFQDFRGSAAACSPSCGGGCGGSCGGGCSSGGCGLGGGLRAAVGGVGNTNQDCDTAAGMWNDYCDSGIPGLPSPQQGIGGGLTCLQCGSGGQCGLGGACRPAPLRQAAGNLIGNLAARPSCGPTCGPTSCGPVGGLVGGMVGGLGCGPVGMPGFGCGDVCSAGGCGTGLGLGGGLPQGQLLAGLQGISQIDLASFGTDACGPECGTQRKITGVDSATCVASGEPCWSMRGPIPWEMFAQGEYIGPPRLRHIDKYRLRVDDQLTLVFRINRERTPFAYQLNVGDQVRIESVADKDLDRILVIQPDGTITARLIGQVMAAGRTTEELRTALEEQYKEFYNKPAITVTPQQVNTKLEDLRATIDGRAGNGGGQNFEVTISPDGTIQLPALGSVPAHGMTLEELNMEINARYAQIVPGFEVTAVLRQRAPRFIYVVGEVGQSGRIELVGPTTVIQAIALAQGWQNGANLRNVIVFRRAEDWRLLATKVDIQGALYGTRPAPSDEIWLRDSDIVIVPKAPIRVIDDAIELIFTNGLYAAAPFLSDPVIFTDASQL